MLKKWTILGCLTLVLVISTVVLLSSFRADATVHDTYQRNRPVYVQSTFDVEILVNGRPLTEYQARGTQYIEALEGSEYELRLRNPTPYRVAVALSVDGLNTIDARRTSAWNASKWVIEPYGSISVTGWQMSSERARRFYFTSERDSYGAKLGQTANLGVISAVFFRERRPVVVPITPPPHSRPTHKEEDLDRSEKMKAPSSGANTQGSTAERRADVAPLPSDDYAATGIGRSVRNDVRWVNLDLDSRPAGEVTLRYEYYQALVRLGVLPRHYPQREPLRRRENATGFEDRRFSPEP